MAALPSLRQGLFGGKSLNRFSSFVTSGAEAYVLNGTTSPKPDVPPLSIKHMFEASDNEESAPRTCDGHAGATTDAAHASEADKHFVDAGPSWRQKVPPFRVLVHSPSKRTSTLSGAYIIYSVTSLFHKSTSEPSDSESVDSDNSPNTSRITVHRRFSQFSVLHTALTRRLPGIALPPLPEKHYSGRFSDDFVEARRGDIERYLARIVRHPLARYTEILTFFLSCENEQVSVASHLAHGS
jgi:sorting nexin-9/18/33